MLKQSVNEPRESNGYHGDESSRCAITLNDYGLILYCDAAVERMFGYHCSDLTGTHISVLLPELARTELISGVNIDSRLAFLCRCGKVFNAAQEDGKLFPAKLSITKIGDTDSRKILLNIFDSRSREHANAVDGL